MHPRTHYTKSGDINIAYQVVGDGPIDLVYVPGWLSHIEYVWENPTCAHFFNRVSSFARLIFFDKRGSGLSDRDVGFATLDERMDDMRAVMDAVDSERAALFGVSEGGSMSALFAATYPERTVALILHACFAKRLWSEDYPWGPTPEARENWVDTMVREWGEDSDVGFFFPSEIDNPQFRSWFGTYRRYAASPQSAYTLGRLNSEIDIRTILPAINVPTLVTHRRGDRHVKIEEGRYLAEHIPDAKFIELPGDDHGIFAGDVDQIVDEIEEFLTGIRRGPDRDRVLLTVLFTDIVDSTSKALELGDRRWNELLERHNAILRRQLRLFRGREVKMTGDGVLAAFDGPARAVQCAIAIRGELRALEINVRAGVHTGECEQRADDLGGIAVHIAARIMDKASAGEVLASSTVKDLVIGSGLAFSERAEETLKGVPGTWRLFTVKAPAEQI
jgi:pimeloyl-ACP methyl ester carboxylesterase